ALDLKPPGRPFLVPFTRIPDRAAHPDHRYLHRYRRELSRPPVPAIGRRFDPLEAGLMTAPIALSAIAGSLTAPHLAARMSPAVVITAGAAISIAGYLTLTQAAPDRPHWIVVVGGAFAVLGLSPAIVLTVD